MDMDTSIDRGPPPALNARPLYTLMTGGMRLTFLDRYGNFTLSIMENSCQRASYINCIATGHSVGRFIRRTKKRTGKCNARLGLGYSKLSARSNSLLLFPSSLYFCCFYNFFSLPTVKITQGERVIGSTVSSTKRGESSVVVEQQQQQPHEEEAADGRLARTHCRTQPKRLLILLIGCPKATAQDLCPLPASIITI